MVKIVQNLFGASARFAAMIMAFLAIFCEGRVFAATPVATWDYDFGTKTYSDWTVNYNGNSTANGRLTIDQTVGAVFTGPDSGLNNSTFIIKCSNLDLSSANWQYLLALHQNNNSADNTYNRVGACLAPQNAKVRGIYDNSKYETEGNGFACAKPLSTGTCLVIKILTSGGVFVYEIAEEASTGAKTLTQVYGHSGLKSSNTNYKGFALGGVNTKASSTLSPATGWTIEKLAVFNSALSDADILAYRFPSDPIAVWDMDFAGADEASGAVRGPFALKANGNTLAANNGKITISTDHGALIDWSSTVQSATTVDGGFASKNFTMLVRYSNMAYANKYTCLGTVWHGGEAAGFDNTISQTWEDGLLIEVALND